MDPKYDFVIVGAGLAGLNSAYQIFKKKPKAKILLLEKNETIGGRIKSVNLHHQHNYEAGAIRFYPSHTHLLKLLREFKQTRKDFYVIPQDMKINYALTHKKYQKYKETDMELYKILLDKKNIESVPEKERLQITLSQYSDKIIGKGKTEYLKVLNAFSHIFDTSMKYGLHLLDRDFVKVPEYYILKNMTLTDLLYQMLDTMKLDLHLSEELVSYQVRNPRKKNGIANVEVKTNLGSYLTNNLILAIPPKPLRKLKILPSRLVNSVFGVPLCRMFAIYPEHNYWYHDIDATYTNEKVQRIYLKGTRLVQIAYSSGETAGYWENLSHSLPEQKKQLQKQLKKMYPKKIIGNPEWLATHYWDVGVNIWKPRVEGNKVTEEIIHPDSNIPVYVANEAYSKQQRWMEGSMEMSHRVVNLIFSNKK